MAEFRFAGDPNPDHQDKAPSITAFGLTFSRRRYTRVDDEAVAAKLRDNSHFMERSAPSRRKARKTAPPGSGGASAKEE